MQSENQVSAVVLLQIENVFMHRFVKKQKSLFTSGLCKIAKIENSNSNTVYFININSFYYTLNKDVVFIRLDYSQTISYLFPHFDNGMSAITLPTNSPHIQNLEQILKNAAVLSDYDSGMMDPSIKHKIQEHCPNVLKEQIHVPDKLKSVISKSGAFLGSAFEYVGSYLTKGAKYAGQYISSSLQQGNTEIKPQTKKRWQDIKQGTNSFINLSVEKVNTLFAPLVEKSKEVAHSIQQKIEKCQNPKVKYAKGTQIHKLELASTSSKAINCAYDGLAKGTGQFVGQLGSQSKNIIGKKFGNDVIKTIVGEEKKEQSQQKIEEEKSQTRQKLNQSEQKPKSEASIGQEMGQQTERKLIQYPELPQKKQTK